MSSMTVAAAHDPVLRTSQLFEGLSELELNAVSAFLEPRRIKDGEVLFREGANGEELYILISGKISAWKTQPDGTQRWLFDVKPGDFFGEMSIIANETRSATLTARTDTELLALHGIDFFLIIYEHPMIGVKMLKAIGRVQNTWLEETSKSLGDLLRWGETARRRAVSDDLTGLYNRSFLEESAKNRFGRGSFGPRVVSLLMMDLDKIHEINNQYGNTAGDQTFIAVADVFRSVTRAEDICARLSGDEFAFLLPDTDTGEAVTIAERVRQTIASKKIRITTGKEASEYAEVSVFISIGIASVPIHADTWEKLYNTADAALRRAKETGRNKVVVAGEG